MSEAEADGPLIAVRHDRDGSVSIVSCVSPAETAVWLIEVAQELLDKGESWD